jgi:coproporphyrinogen III oxidase
MGGLSLEDIKKGFMDVQDHICNFLVNFTGQEYLEDLWDYDKGTGGGRTRLWEDGKIIEKGGMLYSSRDLVIYCHHVIRGFVIVLPLF